MATRDRQASEAIRLPTGTSSHPLSIEAINTKTTEPKSRTKTPDSRKAKCVDSNQCHNSNDFSRSTARFTICSEWGRHQLRAIHHPVSGGEFSTDWKTATCAC